jgi:hypothetical protein
LRVYIFQSAREESSSMRSRWKANRTISVFTSRARVPHLILSSHFRKFKIQIPIENPDSDCSLPCHSSMSVSINSPADFHVHLRQGAISELITPHVRKGGFGLAYVMVGVLPSLKPNLS